MASEHTLSPGLKVSEGRWTARLIYGAAIVAWTIFIQSALNQDFREWQTWLVAGRILMAAAAGILLLATFRGTRANNLTSIYILGCALIQSTYACLEPSNEVEFYKHVSYLVLLSCLTYSGDLSRWLRTQMLPTMIALVAPLFFKSPEMFSSVGTFAFSFTETVSGVIISAVVLRMTNKKYQAFSEVLSLKDELLKAEAQSHAQAQQQLDQLKQELVDFAKYQAIAKCLHLVSHDVRHPITIAKMGIELLSSSKDKQEFESLRTTIQKEIDAASQNVEGLLQDLTCAGNPNVFLSKRSTNAKEFLERQVRGCLLGSQYSKDRIQMNVPPELTLDVNPEKFSRVVVNVLTNAIQATQHNDGNIRISVSENHGMTSLCMSNTDSFIPEEERQWIFEAFFTKGKRNGTGLGLAIVKRLVEAHEGTVECWSEVNASFPRGLVEFRISIPSPAKSKS